MAILKSNNYFECEETKTMYEISSLLTKNSLYLQCKRLYDVFHAHNTND